MLGPDQKSCRAVKHIQNSGLIVIAIQRFPYTKKNTEINEY